MNNEIEKAYYQQMIKDELIIYDVKEFESLKDHEKRWFTDTLYFKLFVIRWHFVRLYEQIKSKLFNSQKHTY